MLEKVRLGRTNLMVTRVSMGCIPIQRLSHADAVALLRRAYDSGVTFYDTAHVYSDSEEKIGQAFAGMRDKVVIASKTMSDTYEKTVQQIDESLRRLRTDYVDLYQWHNPSNTASFLNEHGPYQAMVDAKKAGKIRFIGITNHHLDRAIQAIESDAFDTLQFPMSVLSSQKELDMTFMCRDRDIGFIAMKAMCGGMLPDGRVPFAFLNQYPHIVPIWGLEKASELDQFIQLSKNPEPYTDAMKAEVEKLRAELGDEFCRGCGYCLPCPSDIPLPIVMRIVCFVSRNRPGSQFTPQRLDEVGRIDKCIECRACVGRCPYNLDVPAIIKKQKAGYMKLYEEWMASQ